MNKVKADRKYRTNFNQKTTNLTAKFEFMIFLFEHSSHL